MTRQNLGRQILLINTSSLEWQRFIILLVILISTVIVIVTIIIIVVLMNVKIVHLLRVR